MLRQRVRTREEPLRVVGRLLVAAFALALIWYGAMLALLAAKVISPATANGLSGYRTAYDFFAGLTPADVDGTTRAIIAAAGVAAFVIFGYLAWRELPRPYLARRDVALREDEHGRVIVEPRVLERIAAHAALQQPGVVDASGRYATDELVVGVTVGRSRSLADILRGAQRDVRAALERHELPILPVTLALTGADTTRKRELQ